MKKINVPRRDYRRSDREEPRRAGRGGLFGILGVLCSLAVIVGVAATSLNQNGSPEGTERVSSSPAVVPAPGGEGSLAQTSPVPLDREIPPVKTLEQKTFPPAEPAALPEAEAPLSPMPGPSPAPPPEKPPQRPLPAARGVLALSQPEEAAPSAEVTGTRVRVIRGIELVFVPGGEFMMGSGDSYLDEKPVHRVR